ncbi:MAG: GNAT family N-acetyltransferase [Clostridiales bacterium]|nr:GNAT family N-acetyltransferase [Clostridiales bacterium]
MERIVVYTDSLKDSVFEFTDKCFREIGKAFEPDGRHSFYNDIENEFDCFWCLLDGSEVVGTVAIKKIDDSTAEMKSLYLSSELRGQGYGYKLLDSAVKYAGEKGYKRVVLDSMSKYADALKLYERYGFKPTARYNDNKFADVFMEYDMTYGIDLKEIYLSECSDVFYSEDKNVVLVHWKKYCELEQYRTPLERALDVIRDHEGCDYVADTRDGFEDNPLDTKWVAEYFMPKAKEYGCRIIYFIIDEGNSLKEELEGQEKDSSELLEFRYIYSLDEV